MRRACAGGVRVSSSPMYMNTGPLIFSALKTGDSARTDESLKSATPSSLRQYSTALRLLA